MDMLQKWADALTKPPKELEDLAETLDALRRGEYLAEVKPEDSPLSRIEKDLRLVADMSEKRCRLAEEEATSAKKEARKAAVQAWVSIAVAVTAVIIAVLAWIFPR